MFEEESRVLGTQTQHVVEMVVTSKNSWVRPSQEIIDAYKERVEREYNETPSHDRATMNEGEFTETQIARFDKRRGQQMRQMQCGTFHFRYDAYTNTYKILRNSCNHWRYDPETDVAPCPTCYADRINDLHNIQLRCLEQADQRGQELRVLNVTKDEFREIAKENHLTGKDYSRIPLPDGTVQVLVAQPAESTLGDLYTKEDVDQVDWAYLMTATGGRISGKLGKAVSAPAKDKEETGDPDEEPIKVLSFCIAAPQASRREKQICSRNAMARTKNIPQPTCKEDLKKLYYAKNMTLVHELENLGKKVYLRPIWEFVKISRIHWSAYTDKIPDLPSLSERELVAAECKTVGYDSSRCLSANEIREREEIKWFKAHASDIEESGEDIEDDTDEWLTQQSPEDQQRFREIMAQVAPKTQ